MNPVKVASTLFPLPMALAARTERVRADGKT